MWAVELGSVVLEVGEACYTCKDHCLDCNQQINFCKAGQLTSLKRKALQHTSTKMIYKTRKKEKKNLVL